MSNPRHWLVKQRKFYNVRNEHSFILFLSDKRKIPRISTGTNFFFFAFSCCQSLTLFTAVLPFTVGVYFSSAIKLLPVPLFSLSTIFRDLFSDRWWIKTLGCCYEAGSDEIKWNFCLKNNYISVRAERVLQCKKNCHRKIMIKSCKWSREFNGKKVLPSEIMQTYLLVEVDLSGPQIPFNTGLLLMCWCIVPFRWKFQKVDG